MTWSANHKLKISQNILYLILRNLQNLHLGLTSNANLLSYGPKMRDQWDLLIDEL